MTGLAKLLGLDGKIDTETMLDLLSIRDSTLPLLWASHALTGGKSLSLFTEEVDEIPPSWRRRAIKAINRPYIRTLIVKYIYDINPEIIYRIFSHIPCFRDVAYLSDGHGLPMVCMYHAEGRAYLYPSSWEAADLPAGDIRQRVELDIQLQKENNSTNS